MVLYAVLCLCFFQGQPRGLLFVREGIMWKWRDPKRAAVLVLVVCCVSCCSRLFRPVCQSELQCVIGWIAGWIAGLG